MSTWLWWWPAATKPAGCRGHSLEHYDTCSHGTPPIDCCIHRNYRIVKRNSRAVHAACTIVHSNPLTIHTQIPHELVINLPVACVVLLVGSLLSGDRRSTNVADIQVCVPCRQISPPRTFCLLFIWKKLMESLLKNRLPCKVISWYLCQRNTDY